MDEKHYKGTYSTINPNRCVFEKAINSRICNCNKSQRFNLADREGVACTSASSLHRCDELLQHLHTNARFALQKLDVNMLGHAQEIKIQNGGLLGLQKSLNDDNQNCIEDINSVVSNAIKKYDNLKDFPYSQIMQVINSYSIRSKKKRNKKDRK